MAKIDAKTLLEAGVHFGHRTDKWNPKMAPYIYEARNGIHIINLMKTVDQIEAAATFLKEIAESGGRILFVGTKKAAQDSVKELSQRCNGYYVTERWLGGMLTNLNTIRKSVQRMNDIDAMEASGAFKGMPKQEVSALRRESAKIHRNLDGIKHMEKQPQAVVVIDTVREEIALTEARKLKIPVVGLVDTNANPELVQFPIAANDDAIRAIRSILEVLCAGVSEGNVVGTKKAAEEKKAAKSPAREKENDRAGEGDKPRRPASKPYAKSAPAKSAAKPTAASTAKAPATKAAKSESSPESASTEVVNKD